jgi:23S rRNA pseudouridine2605 synthase
LKRLHKVMAEAGVASRRKCEQLILQGKVKVDGEIIQDVGFKVDPVQSLIEVDGKKLKASEKKIYILLNKPAGYITSVGDTHKRPTVMNLIDEDARIFPVGRLDRDTEGLLLLTNDGELAYRITHPSFEIEKTYQVIVRGIPGLEDVAALREGILLDDGITAPAGVVVRESSKTSHTTTLEITIHEGRKRQIRRMCQTIGHPVLYLKRIRLGFLKLESLEAGKYRMLTEEEMLRLKKLLRIS